MQSIRKNLFYQAFYEILIVILPIITSPYVSRVLGASNIGIYSFTYTIADYFVLVAALGIKNYGNREISRCRDDQEKLNKTFSGILFLHFTVSAIVIVGYIVYYFLADPEYKTYVLVQSLYVIAAFFDISWFFFGLEQFRVTVVRNTIIRVLSVICIFIFVREESDLFIYITILALSSLVSQLWLWVRLRPLVKIVRVSSKEVFRHLPQMLILFIPTIAVSLYNYMDKVMLGAMAGTTELGFYENAFKISTVCSSVICSVGTVMLPRMSNLMAKGKEIESRKYIKLSMDLVLMVSCALAFGIAAVADVFAPVFWGSEFSACGILLIFMGVVLPIKGFANILRTQYLIPSRMDKQYTVSLCCGAGCNLAINAILIPNLQSVGAAIGTVAAELAVCVVQAIYASKKLPVLSYLAQNYMYFIFGAIMFLIVFAIGKILSVSLLTLIIQIVVGVIIYGGLCLVYLFRTKSELLTIALRRKQ